MHSFKTDIGDKRYSGLNRVKYSYLFCEIADITEVESDQFHDRHDDQNSDYDDTIKSGERVIL